MRGNAPSGRAGGAAPAFVYQERSGASEHDAFFFPQRRGYVAAAPPGPAGRISGGLKASGSWAAGALPSLEEVVRGVCANVKSTVVQQVDRMADAMRILQAEKEDAGATVAQLENILAVTTETVQILSEQLTAARRQIQASEAPLAASPAGYASPGSCTSSLAVEPSQSGGEQAPRAPTFEQKSLTELLSNCFNNVEAAIRKVPILDLVPKNNGRPTKHQFQVILMLQQHLGSKTIAYELLKDAQERYPAMIALISHTIVDWIFQDQIIGTKANFAGRVYLTAYEEEQKATNYNHPRIRDLKYRHGLSEQRAAAASDLVGAKGFWKWLNSTTYSQTVKIVREFAVCFPDSFHYSLTQDLHRAVSEAVRLAVRMRTEPTLIEYSFPPTGTPWASPYHVHRNPELNGQTLSDNRSPYCVKVAITPLIKAKSFANNMVDLKTVHKAEVIVGDRAILLPQMNRRR